jgi:RimJ/RimL family protein N-acetyltransferase
MPRVKPVVMTARLALRQFTAADVDNLAALDGDPAVLRFISRDTRSRADVEREVLPSLLAYYDQHPGFGKWAAETRATREFIGWFGLRSVVPRPDAMVFWDDGPADGPADAGTASLGYRLMRQAWGNGYATEGSRALLRIAFTELDISEVVATTMAVNVGSRRVMEKAGLRYARTVHVHWPDPVEGYEHGDVEYRLSRADWTGS